MSHDAARTAEIDQTVAASKDHVETIVTVARDWMAAHPEDLHGPGPEVVLVISMMDEGSARGLAVMMARALAESDWRRKT